MKDSGRFQLLYHELWGQVGHGSSRRCFLYVHIQKMNL